MLLSKSYVEKPVKEKVSNCDCHLHSSLPPKKSNKRLQNAFPLTNNLQKGQTETKNKKEKKRAIL